MTRWYLRCSKGAAQGILNPGRLKQAFLLRHRVIVRIADRAINTQRSHTSSRVHFSPICLDNHVSVLLCCKTCEDPRPEIKKDPHPSVLQAMNVGANSNDDLEIWANFRISLINKNGKTKRGNENGK